MKRTTIFLLMGIVWALFSTAYGQTKSAREVWSEYKAKPRMLTFLDALAESREPKSFIPFFQEFVNTSIDKNKVEFEALKEEFVETILNKDPEVALFFGVCLALRAKTLPEVFSILKLLPMDYFISKKFYYNGAYPNSQIAQMNALANDCKTISIANRPELTNVMIMPDGKILIRFTYTYDGYAQRAYRCPLYVNKVDDKYYDSFNLSILSANASSFEHDVRSNASILMFDPKGLSCAGQIRKRGVTYDGEIGGARWEDIKAGDDLFLYYGFTLDNNGNVTGDGVNFSKGVSEKLMSFAEIGAKEQKQKEEAAAESKRRLRNQNRKLNQKLIARYGEKAYNAMYSNTPYKGMPEGAVSGYRFYMNNVPVYKFILVGTYVDLLGPYKKYEANLGISVSGWSMPTIYVRKGKVVSWNDLF